MTGNHYLIKIGFAVACCFLFGCEKFSNTRPEADFQTFPELGDSLTVFIFDANNSTDYETRTWQLQMRWDIHDDGIWETDFDINKTYSWRFNTNGLKKVTVEIKDSQGDTHKKTREILVQPVIRDSTIIDSRDSCEYKVVEVYGQWWMAENLRYGVTLDKDQFPKDNEIVESYKYVDTYNSSTSYGSFYTWNEATNYLADEDHGICPEGWRIPIREDIDHLRNLLWFRERYDEFLLGSGIFKMNIQKTGLYFYPSGQFSQQGEKGYFWMNEDEPFPRFSTCCNYDTKLGLTLISDHNPFTTRTLQWREEWGLFSFQKIAMPLRCVKE